jgi:hypothetical protein
MEQPNLNYINELSGDNLEFRTKNGILKKELPKEIIGYSEKWKILIFRGRSICS